ncbi:MAG: ribbon-helix-helix domain-containing protein [Alphaproteobacteria bacterium]
MFWETLKEIARAEEVLVAALVAEIDVPTQARAKPAVERHPRLCRRPPEGLLRQTV